MKVIIADDSITIRRVVSGMLNDMGGAFEYLMADGGDVALEHLDANPDVGLILLDWNMNVMNGLDCLRAIRTRENMKHIPVVMITAQSEQACVDEALACGANCYLVKPFTPEKFQETISAFIAK